MNCVSDHSCVKGVYFCIGVYEENYLQGPGFFFWAAVPRVATGKIGALILLELN